MKSGITKKVTAKSNIYTKRAEKWIRGFVKASTTLPPKVQGQLRCYLRLRVDEVLWYTAKPPKTTFVRVIWWGEDGPGTVFRPIDSRLDNGSTRAETDSKFEVRSGPKQFSAYLKDMGNLILEVLAEGYVPIGVATVPNLQKLNAQTNISGLYPIRTQSGENMGELKIALHFQSIADNAETSSIPTPDISVTGSIEPEPVNPPQFIRMEKPRVDISDDPFMSPDTNRSFPSGVDSKLQQFSTERPSRSRRKVSKSRSRSGSTDKKDKKGVFNHKNGLNYDEVRSSYCDDVEKLVMNDNPIEIKENGSSGKEDLLSNILERGVKLRNEMAISSRSSKPLKSCLRKSDEFFGLREQYDFDDGLYAQEILKHSDYENDGFKRAVDLVVGDTFATERLRTIKAFNNNLDSSDAASMTDVNDPIYDDKILNNLLYNETVLSSSDISDGAEEEIIRTLGKDSMKSSSEKKAGIERLNLSLECDGNKRPPSRTSSAGSLTSTPLSTPRVKKAGRKRSKSAGKRRTRSSSSEKRCASDSETRRRKLGKKKLDTSKALTIDRVALLGKVSVARINVSKLSLKSLESTKKKKKAKDLKGKPPRPGSGTKSSTYFIEYHFPCSVTDTRSRKSSMGTEIVRFASKKIVDGDINFGHKTAFPVVFDGSGIEKWIKSKIVYKVFSKTPGNRIPKLIGTSILYLKNVIMSPELFISEGLDVRDRARDGDISSDTGNEANCPIIGKLKVTLELAGNENEKFQEQIQKAKVADVSDSKTLKMLTTPESTLKSIKPIEVVRQEPENRSINNNSTPYSPITLQTMIMIPQGTGISFQGISTMKSSSTESAVTMQDQSFRNSFLSCRMFWSDEVYSSCTCWGTFDPEYHFVQVTPVIFDQTMVERFKNNWAIIEVWNKSVNSEENQLIGLVKLSVHQFYISYKDRAIAESLIQSEYPVIAIDGVLPIIHPISHKQYGSLKVVLAIGTQDQIFRFQRSRSQNYSKPTEIQKTKTNNERYKLAVTKEYSKSNLFDGAHSQLVFKRDSFGKGKKHFFIKKKSIGKYSKKIKNRNCSAGSNKKLLANDNEDGEGRYDNNQKKSLPLHKFKISSDILKSSSQDSSNTSEGMPILRNNDLMSLKRSERMQSKGINLKDFSINDNDIFINERTGEKFSFVNGTMKTIDNCQKSFKGVDILYDPPQKISLQSKSKDSPQKIQLNYEKYSRKSKKNSGKKEFRADCKCKYKEREEDFFSHSHSFDTEDESGEDVRVNRRKKFEFIISGRSVDEFGKSNKIKEKVIKNTTATRDDWRLIFSKNKKTSKSKNNYREERSPKSLSIFDLLPSRAVIGLPVLSSTKLDNNRNANAYMNMNDNCKKVEPNSVNQQENEKFIDHIFEVNIESIKSLANFDSLLWGEADCFVQYHFPTQIRERTNPNVQPAPVLKAYRTATTLCIPDPKFGDKLRHKLTLAESSAIQREIVGACAGAGGGAGGISFEIWCRFYHPNVRDQVVAKTQLPVAKLCALATMHRYGEPSEQTFHLPLSNILPEHARDHDPEADIPHSEPSGFLEISVNYQSKVSRLLKDKECDQNTIRLSVNIQKICGLRAAAVNASKSEPSLSFTPDIGLNPYLRVNLSMLTKDEERITQTIARTLAGNFSCHFDFPLPLLWFEGDDTRTLAEDFEREYLYLELWHQANEGLMDSRSRRTYSTSPDSLIGHMFSAFTSSFNQAIWNKIVVPLQTAEAVQQNDKSLQEYLSPEYGLENVVGGLEVGMKLSRGIDDWRRIVDIGRVNGWEPDNEIEQVEHDFEEDFTGQECSFSFKVNHLTFPINKEESEQKLHVYIKLRFFNNPPFFSHLWKVQVNSYGYATVDANLHKEFKVESSRSLNWYLREEQLEVQVWSTKEPRSTKERPVQKDKLIGSAYIDLLPTKKSRKISGVYPLFKPACSNMGGACIHVSLDMHSSITDKVGDYSNIRTVDDVPDDCFLTRICIERAFHLPLVDCPNTKDKIAPSAYVTFQSAEKDDPLCTAAQTSSNPIWNYEADTLLYKYLLHSKEKDLIFKVWHARKSDLLPEISTDKVLGYVTVDLKPLKAGLQQISGYYNIMDFVGKCQGQIFICVAPVLIRSSNIDKVQLGSTTPAPIRPLSPNFEIEVKSMSKSSSDVFSALRHWHQQVRTAKYDIQPSSPSRSDLMKELKSNMSELDNITGKLKEKLNFSPPRIESDRYKSPSENRSTDEEFLPILERARALLNSSENTSKSPDSSLTDFLPRRYNQTLTQQHIGISEDRIYNSNNNSSTLVSDKEEELNDTINAEEEEKDGEEANAYAAAYTEENSREISWISSAHHSKSQDMLNTDMELNGDLDLEEELQSNSLILLPKSLNNVSDVDFSNWEVGMNTMAVLREEIVEVVESKEIASENINENRTEEDNSQKTSSSPITIIESDQEKKLLPNKALDDEEKEETSRKSSSSTMLDVSLPGLSDKEDSTVKKSVEAENFQVINSSEIQSTELQTNEVSLKTDRERVRDRIEAAGLVWSSDEDEVEIEISEAEKLDSSESDQNEIHPVEDNTDNPYKPEEIPDDVNIPEELDELEEQLEVRSSVSSIRKDNEEVNSQIEDQNSQDNSFELDDIPKERNLNLLATMPSDRLKTTISLSSKPDEKKTMPSFSLKTLPTAEQTKRIAKIFSSKFNAR